MSELDERYRDLIEELEDHAIFLLDAQGRVQSWNKGAQRLLGYAREEILGHSASIFFTLEERDRGVPETELREAARTGRASDDRWQMRKGGKRIWVNGITQAVYDDAKQLIGFGKVMRDQTARKLTQDRVAAQYAVTLILADTASLQEATPRIVQVVCEKLGWQWGALWVVDHSAQVLRCVETRDCALDSPVEFERVSRTISLQRGVGLPGRVWETGEPAWIEDVTKDPNFPRAPVALRDDLHAGAAFPIRLDADVLGVIEFISRDVRAPDEELLRMMSTIGSQIGQFIQRRNAEAGLRSSEARKSGILQAALDCIISMNHEGIVVEWNAAAEQVFGYAHAEAVGKALADLIVPPPLRESHWQGLARYLETGEGPVVGKRIEITGMRADGSEFPVELAITRVELPGPPLFTAYLRDIKARLRAEAELKLAKESAEAANEAKDRFLAMLSHELRTPLTPVLAAAAELENEPALTDQSRESLLMIRRNVELEARLIDDLLDVTRIARGKVELQTSDVDLHELLGQVAQMTRGDALAKRQVLSLDLRAARHHAVGDPARLQQVFWNLIKNAIKFTGENGQVSVRSTSADDGSILIEVQDSGIGIEPDVMRNLFSAFEQGGREITRQFGGLGLGLAISKTLVDLHGGEIRASSEGPGRGATFSVRLPAAGAAGGDALQPPATAAQPRPALRVLLIEDHQDTLHAMSRLLSRLGYQVSGAVSVATALQLAGSHPFDLVISDLGLPDGSGLELMRSLRERYGLRGIALTGFGMDDDIRSSIDAGFVEHLTKPVNFQRLQEVLHRLGES